MSELDTRNPASNRQAWQPLGYEKISATEAEASITLAGVDGAIYS